MDSTPARHNEVGGMGRWPEYVALPDIAGKTPVMPLERAFVHG